MPRFNAQAAIASIETKMARSDSVQESILAALQGLMGQPQTQPANAPVNARTGTLPNILPVNHSTVATEAPVRGNFLTQPELAARAATQTGVHADEGDEYLIQPLPTDDPNAKGPVWSSKTLRNKWGTFPAHHRRQDPQTKRLETVRYDCSPADRSNFMAATNGRQFGFEATLAIPAGDGTEKIVRFPAVCSLEAKQFSSFNHGLYGQVKTLILTLPDGSEYVLDGQVNLQLKKRMQ